MISPRTMVHWRSRESDNILKGYKLDIQVIVNVIFHQASSSYHQIIIKLSPNYHQIIIKLSPNYHQLIFFQTMIGSKAPPSILNWVFKYMHCRKVYIMISYHLYMHRRKVSCLIQWAHIMGSYKKQVFR